MKKPLDVAPRIRSLRGRLAHLFAWTEGGANSLLCGRWLTEEDTYRAKREMRVCRGCSRQAERLQDAYGEAWERDMEKLIEEYGGPAYADNPIHPADRKGERAFKTRSGEVREV